MLILFLQKLHLGGVIERLKLKLKNMKPIDIFHEEQNNFFAKQTEYEKKHSERDEDGVIIEIAIMPHKGYNFSMSYDALENAMERYALQKIDEYKLNAL